MEESDKSNHGSAPTKEMDSMDCQGKIIPLEPPTSSGNNLDSRKLAMDHQESQKESVLQESNKESSQKKSLKDLSKDKIP